MRKFHVQLTAPVIELVLKAKDISGVAAELVVGFKRKTIAEANTFVELCDNVTNALVGPAPVQVPVLEAGVILAEPLPDTRLRYLTAEDKEAALKSLIKSEILYLKNIQITLEATDSQPEDILVVEDTRNALKAEALWGESSKCLDFLLDVYLTSAPWSASFISALYSIALNIDFGADAEVKNS